jgi:hypothetical protein
MTFGPAPSSRGMKAGLAVFAWDKARLDALGLGG